jgi:hypothetical protein
MIAINVGIAVLGVVGGAVVALGLTLTARQRAGATAALVESGERAAATVVSMTFEGMQRQWRRVRLRCDDGREVHDRLDSAAASRLALTLGERRTVVRSTDPQVEACRLVDALGADANSARVAVIAGVVIAALGVAAAFAL